jgi:hypothetical protein
MENILSLTNCGESGMCIHNMPLTTPMYDLSTFYLFFSPLMFCEPVRLEATPIPSEDKYLLQAIKSVLEAGFIISLLNLQNYRAKEISHYPSFSKENKQFKTQMRDNVVAAMVVCDVAPLIANYLFFKNSRTGSGSILEIKSIMTFLIYFFSFNTRLVESLLYLE